MRVSVRSWPALKYLTSHETQEYSLQHRQKKMCEEIETIKKRTKSFDIPPSLCAEKLQLTLNIVSIYSRLAPLMSLYLLQKRFLELF